MAYLQESELTLSKCVDIRWANEATTAQLKDMHGGEPNSRARSERGQPERRF